MDLLDFLPTQFEGAIKEYKANQRHYPVCVKYNTGIPGRKVVISYHLMNMPNSGTQ